MADYRCDLIQELRAKGCSYLRPANGSHEPWESPHSGKRFVVQRDLRSRVAANNVLKQAGLPPIF